MATSGEKSESGIPSAANVLDGFLNFAATAAATNVIVIPAGRTWVGTVSIQCAVQNAAAVAAAASAIGIVSVAGAGVAPVAGNYLRCDALVGANAAGGLTGDEGEASNSTPLVVIAPAGNAVQIQAAATIVGTAGSVNVSAIGALQ